MLICAYLLIGSLLLLAYVLIFLVLIGCRPEESCSETKDEHLVLLEYQTLNEEVRRRGEMLAIHGSIFVVACLALLAAAVSVPTSHFARVAMVFLSLLIYGMWSLVVTCTSQRLDDITFARLRGIEGQLGFQVHLYVKGRAAKWWSEIRRFIWGFVLILIWLGGYFLLLKM